MGCGGNGVDVAGIVGQIEQPYSLIMQIIGESKTKALLLTSIANKNEVSDLTALIPTYTMTLDQLNDACTNLYEKFKILLTNLAGLATQRDPKFYAEIRQQFAGTKSDFQDLLSLMYQIPSILKGIYDAENFTNHLQESYNGLCTGI